MIEIKTIKNFDATQKSSFINMGLKPISILLGMVYTPMLLSYLGNEKYGLWSTVLSIISWVNYCDIGIGQGLRNLLAKELSNKEFQKAQRSVSTAYVVLTIISGIILLISIAMIASINLNKVFNTTVDMRAPLIISIACICINFVLALSNTVLFAMQKSERVAIRNCLVQLLNIVGVYFLSKISDSNLLYLAVLFGTTSMIVYIANSAQIFKDNRSLLPRLRYFEKAKVSEISNVGIKFFIIQIACIALYTVDNLLITNLFGGEAVTPFNITYKLFNTAYAFLAALIVPYWSKTTDALAQGDIVWIKQSIKRLNVIGIVFCVGYVVLAIAFKPIAAIWLHKSLEYPDGLVIVMCIYYCLYSIVSVNTQFINGIGKINGQLVIMVLMGALNIPLSIFLAKTMGLGVVGVRLATTVLMAIATVYFPIDLYRIIKSIDKETIREND